MSKISICKSHGGDRVKAKNVADEVAQSIGEHYGVHYGWEGDELHFSRPGVTGCIRIDDDNINVDAKLGLMLSMLKGPIELEIQRKLDDMFV